MADVASEHSVPAPISGAKQPRSVELSPLPSKRLRRAPPQLKRGLSPTTRAAEARTRIEQRLERGRALQWELARQRENSAPNARGSDLTEARVRKSSVAHENSQDSVVHEKKGAGSGPEEKTVDAESVVEQESFSTPKRRRRVDETTSTPRRSCRKAAIKAYESIRVQLGSARKNKASMAVLALAEERAEARISEIKASEKKKVVQQEKKHELAVRVAVLTSLTVSRL